ncbi:MAG: GHKL domain-containing protein, partial [Oscillospiraceae bacterium]
NLLNVFVTNGNIILMAQAIVLILLSFTVNVIDIFFEQREKYDISFFYWLMIVVTPIGSITIIIILYLLTGNNIQSIVIVSILLILNMFDAYVYEQAIKIMKVEREREILIVANNGYEKQLDIIQKSYNNITSIKHDLKNHMIFIHSLAENKNYGEIIKYTDTFLKNMQKEKVWSNCGHGEIDGFINYKLSEISKLGTKIECKISHIETEGLEKYDLAIIIGNLMDNAYQAIKNSESKRLYFLLKSEKNIIYLKMWNVFDTELLIENNIFSTTKSDNKNHGYGMVQIKNIVEKYNGNIDIKTEKDKFIIDLMLYSKNCKL